MRGEGEAEAEQLARRMRKLHMRRETLLWLIPILIASGVFVVICVNPAALMGRLFFPVLIVFGLVGPIGAFWGIYQSIRYEQSPLKYSAVMLIPLGFLWYYFERYKKRISPSGVNPEGHDSR